MKVDRTPYVTFLLILTNFVLYFGFQFQELFSVADPFNLNLILYQFSHANAAHVIWNMFFLSLFGPLVEQKLGHIRYLTFYLLCGIMAVLSFLPFAPEGLQVLGASASISGIIAAYLFVHPNKIMTLIAVFVCGLMIFKEVEPILMGFYSATEVGHLFGLLSGLLLYNLFHKKECNCGKNTRKRRIKTTNLLRNSNRSK